MSDDLMWNNEAPALELGIDVPRWIDKDISPNDIAAIIQGGCESGAYMPAVTYHMALDTMSEHGDDVFNYLEGSLGEIPPVPEDKKDSWSGMACFYLSCAVELWASEVCDEVLEKLEENES